MKNINYGVVAFICVIFICSLTLFVRPIVGMADNGDFFRIISQSNMYYLESNNEHSFLGYFNKDYGIYKYNNENQTTIVSTQFILTKLAVSIDKFITKDSIFDLRFLAFIYMLVHAFSSYFIVRVFTEDVNSKRFKLLITALFVFIFCDTGYVAYFNSFFGEAVNLSFFLFSIGILLYMYKFKKYTLLNLILFFLSSLVFIGSKQQLAPLGILVALILFRLFVTTTSKGFFRYTALSLAGIIIISSLYFYKSISGDFDYINRYHAMTRGILLYESNPDDILKEFNINPQYSLLQGTTYSYSNTVPIIGSDDEKLKEEFYSKYSFFSILIFYLKHPTTFLKMINLAVVNGYSIRPAVIGNYEKIEGKSSGQQSYFFSLWSGVKEHYMPHNLFLTLVAFAVYFYFAAKRYLMAKRNDNIQLQLFEEVFLYVFLVGVSQIFISIIGAGDADLAKHMFMFNVSFDLMFLYSVCVTIKELCPKSNTAVEGGKNET